MSIYDANKDRVRYRYMQYNTQKASESIFYIGTNIMKEVGFNAKDRIMIMPEANRKNHFFFKKDGNYGNLLNWCSSKVKSNFGRLRFHDSLRKNLGLRKSRKLLTLKHEIRLDPHDPQNNKLIIIFE